MGSAVVAKYIRIPFRLLRPRTRISSWHQNNYSCSCIAFLTVGNAGIVKSVHHQRFFLFMFFSSALFIGLMSGTSLDGVVGVFVVFFGFFLFGCFVLLFFFFFFFFVILRTTLMQLQTARKNNFFF